MLNHKVKDSCEGLVGLGIYEPSQELHRCQDFVIPKASFTGVHWSVHLCQGPSSPAWDAQVFCADPSRLPVQTMQSVCILIYALDPHRCTQQDGHRCRLQEVLAGPCSCLSLIWTGCLNRSVQNTCAYRASEESPFAWVKRLVYPYEWDLSQDLSSGNKHWLWIIPERSWQCPCGEKSRRMHCDGEFCNLTLTRSSFPHFLWLNTNSWIRRTEHNI